MNKKRIQVTIVVNDYDEAILFYRDTLQFDLLEDTKLNDTKRWVLVAPKGGTEFCFLLAKAANEQQQSRVGNQTGGRVFLFLYVEKFEGFYQHLLQQQVRFVRGPVKEAYGTVAVFDDLYGNLWDLIGAD